MSKVEAIIEFMLQCPVIQSNPLFFNAIKAQDNSKQIITLSSDVALHSKFIDGSVLKRYSFTIIDFRSISYLPIPKPVATTTEQDIEHENVDDILDVQSIIDWVEAQKDAGEYPDFGENCIIDDMFTTSDTPNLNGIDTGLSPALAKYSITIQIDYIDTQKQIFK